MVGGTGPAGPALASSHIVYTFKNGRGKTKHVVHAASTLTNHGPLSHPLTAIYYPHLPQIYSLSCRFGYNYSQADTTKIHDLAPKTALVVSFMNFCLRLLLVQTTSHPGCLKPSLHLLPLRSVTFSIFPSPLAWCLLTGSPPSLSPPLNYPLCPILHPIIGLFLFFVSSVNFL